MLKHMVYIIKVMVKCGSKMLYLGIFTKFIQALYYWSQKIKRFELSIDPSLIPERKE